MLWQEEDRDGRRSLQAGQGLDQGQRQASVARRASDSAIQGLRASSHPRTGQVWCVNLHISCAFGRLVTEANISSEGVDIRVRVTGGGHTSQVYAVRQAIAKSIVRVGNSFLESGMIRRTTTD